MSKHAVMGVDLSGQVVLRWDSTSSCARLLQSGGIDAVWLCIGDDAVASSCRAAGTEVLPANAIRLLGLEEAGRAQPGEAVAVRAGVWPGVQGSSRDSSGGFLAGATRQAWVNANGYLVAYLRALFPRQAPVLGYLPDRDAGIAGGRVIAFNSVELALIDSWCAGGNYILSMDAAYRDALLNGNPAAMTAWKQMGRTARWLKEQRSLFRQPTVSTITVLVEPGETTAEIANLMYRQSASPDLTSAARVPLPDPARRAIVVAAGIRSLSAEGTKVLLAHARAGATVVTDACQEQAWWRVPCLKTARNFDDREFYALGHGRIVAYKQAIVDPGEFALDVIDLAADRRPVRIWNAPAAIAAVSQAGPRAKPVLWVVNYGSPARSGIMAHVRVAYEPDPSRSAPRWGGCRGRVDCARGQSARRPGAAPAIFRPAPVIEQNPKAVFIRRTHVAHKVDEEAKRQEGLRLAQAIFVPRDGPGVPITHRVVLKPNATSLVPGSRPPVENWGTGTDPQFYEGLVLGLKQLGLTRFTFIDSTSYATWNLRGLLDINERLGVVTQDPERRARHLREGWETNWSTVPEGVVFKRIPHYAPVNEADTWLLQHRQMEGA